MIVRPVLDVLDLDQGEPAPSPLKSCQPVENRFY